MTDAATASEVTPDADPLGRRRCANCLYDRFGLADRQPCPECGYVLPAGVVVMTLPRPRERWWLWVINFGGLILMIALAIRGSGNVVRNVASTSAFVLPGIAAIVVRTIRIAWSDHAYVVQVWMNSDGIGIEHDADRYSPLRPIARAATPMLGYVAIVACVMLDFVDMNLLTFFTIPISVVALGTGAVWRTRRRAAIPRLDDVAPQMLRWNDARYQIQRDGDAVGLKLNVVGFWVVPSGIRCAGDEAVASAIVESIERCREIAFSPADAAPSGQVRSNIARIARRIGRWFGRLARTWT